MVRILEKSEIGIAAKILECGGLVAFPTETVYGLGGNAYDDDAVSKIFQCKRRPRFNPISVCYPDFRSAEDDVEITEFARKLADKFMPGPITLVLKRKKTSRVSWLCSAGGDTLGIRVPDNGIAIGLLKKLSFPLAAPSANRSHGMSATSAREAACGMNSVTVLDGGVCKVGIESAIIDLTGETPAIIRPGAVSAEQLSEVSGTDFVIENRQLTKHYQTSKKVVANALSAAPNDAFVGFGDTECPLCRYSDNLSKAGDVNEAAKNFFSMLRRMDATDAEKICIAPIPNTGAGLAINSKLEQMV